MLHWFLRIFDFSHSERYRSSTVLQFLKENVELTLEASGCDQCMGPVESLGGGCTCTCTYLHILPHNEVSLFLLFLHFLAASSLLSVQLL